MNKDSMMFAIPFLRILSYAAFFKRWSKRLTLATGLEYMVNCIHVTQKISIGKVAFFSFTFSFSGGNKASIKNHTQFP